MSNRTVRAGRDLYDTTHRRDTTKQDTGTKVSAGRQKHQDTHKTTDSTRPQNKAQK